MKQIRSASFYGVLLHAKSFHIYFDPSFLLNKPRWRERNGGKKLTDCTHGPVKLFFWLFFFFHSLPLLVCEDGQLVFVPDTCVSLFFNLGHGPGAWLNAHTHVLTVRDRTERTAYTCYCCELCLFHSIHSPAFSIESWVNRRSLCWVLSEAGFQGFLLISCSSGDLFLASFERCRLMSMKSQNRLSNDDLVCFQRMIYLCLSRLLCPVWKTLLDSLPSVVLEKLFFFSFVRQKAGHHVVSEFAATAIKVLDLRRSSTLAFPTLTAVQRHSWVCGDWRWDIPPSAAVFFAKTSEAEDMEN